jgi:hypothetical protein
MSNEIKPGSFDYSEKKVDDMAHNPSDAPMKGMPATVPQRGGTRGTYSTPYKPPAPSKKD